MSRAVLISIRPKWCELIASGKKTIEVEAKNRNTDGLRVYIETETLLACDAKKEA